LFFYQEKFRDNRKQQDQLELIQLNVEKVQLHIEVLVVVVVFPNKKLEKFSLLIAEQN
jgi:hypothetical protein